MSEVKPVSAKEYRKAMTKVIRLPSGFHFKIRKMPPSALAKLMKVYGELPPARRDLTPEEKERLRRTGMEKFADIIAAIIPDCVVEPKISTNPKSEDELSLQDLPSDDLFALLDEITAFSGLTGPTAKARETFREKPTG